MSKEGDQHLDLGTRSDKAIGVIVPAEMQSDRLLNGVNSQQSSFVMSVAVMQKWAKQLRYALSLASSSRRTSLR